LQFIYKRIEEYNPMDTKNESHSNLLGSYTKEETKGRYLYGDYTPLEEKKNIIHVLKDFVSTSANIIEIHKKVGTLRFVLENIDLFQDEIIRKIGSLQISVEASLDVFHSKYHEKIVSSPDVKKEAESSFFRMRAPLINSIGDIEKQFTKYTNEYREEIQERIIDSYSNATTLLQLWLSKDSYNLPDTILGRRNKVLTAKIDRDPYSYNITSSNEIIGLNYTGSSSSADANVDGLERLPASTFSYHFTIDSKFSEFWKHRRKVSDLGVDDLLIPIGFKKSISEKLRRSLRLGSNQEDPQDSSEREIEYIHASSLYITYVRMDTGKTLAVKLSGDPSRSDEKSVELEYELSGLQPQENNASSNNSITTIAYYNGLKSEGRLPRLNYVDREERRKIDLTQKEFQQATDILRIVMMGKMLADKINEISNTSTVSHHMKLDSIRVGDKEAIMSSSNSSKTLLYYEDIVMSFLELVAVGFSPLIQHMSEKSPIKGELILRYETDEKVRTEYVLRTEELSAPLSDDEGRRVLERLKL
jgi:hypothetical protein